MANKKWSQFDSASSLSDSDEGVGLVSSGNKRFTFATLRALINTGVQTIVGNITHTGNQTTSGKITANQFEGNGALITGVTAAGVGGTSSTGSLTVECNSDNSTPAAKIVFSKYTTDLADLDENSFAPKTGIPYSHADDAIPFNKDLDLQNKQIIRSQTIIDQQIGPYAQFDGLASHMSAADNINLNFGTYDFSFIIGFRASMISSTRYMYNKGTTVQVVAYMASGKFNFYVSDGTTTVNIISDDTYNDNELHIAGVTCDRDGLLITKIDGITQQDTAPSPSLTLTSATTTYLASYDGATYNFDGSIQFLMLFNKVITDAEFIALTSNPCKSIPVRYEKASQTALTSGALIIGMEYEIDLYVSGDDFTNVGAASNATGIEFVATGTTPTTWTNSSSLRHTGCIASWKSLDLVDDTAWKESMHNNHFINFGGKIYNKSEQLTENDGGFTAALTCGTSGTITLDTASDTLSYKKHGGLMHVSGQISVNSVSSPVGDLILNGLPEPCADLTELSGRAVFTVISVGTLAASVDNSLAGRMIEGDSVVYIRDGIGAAGGNNTDFASHIQAGSELQIYGVYPVD